MELRSEQIDLQVYLRELIKKTLGVDVRLATGRKREVVNARMIYSDILRGKGWSYKAIGRSIIKDHATIMHYVKNIDPYMKTDSTLRNHYSLVLRSFSSYKKSDLFLTEDELQDEIKNLRDENKKLSLELIRLKTEVKTDTDKKSRLNSILNIVSTRTPKGQEQKIEALINRLYNGVQS